MKRNRKAMMIAAIAASAMMIGCEQQPKAYKSPFLARNTDASTYYGTTRVLYLSPNKYGPAKTSTTIKRRPHR